MSKRDHELEMNNLLKKEEEMKKKSLDFIVMQETRQNLPVFKYREKILQDISFLQVVIISGETGSGKTTQIPQYILEDQIENGSYFSGCGFTTNICVTQPGRISAISIAQRVANERGEVLKQKKPGSVGYQVRHEKCLPRKNGSIYYCTTGILLQKLKEDPLLSQFSHIIIDEVHQRNKDTDFLLAVMKDVLKSRTNLKLILMSASMDESVFQNYFPFHCPIIRIPGRTFPVKEFYLEDVVPMVECQLQDLRRFANMNRYEILEALKSNEETNLNLVSALIKHIHENDKDKTRAILVFLTGWSELQTVGDLLKSHPNALTNDASIHYLHSMIDLSDQQEVFQKPIEGCRKIVLSTNIAETSVTIDDIVYVIDSGKMKLSKYNFEKNEKSLDSDWISKSNAKQRAGRAGRVQRGVCFHIYSKEKAESMEPFIQPEILRSPLEETILHIKRLELGSAHEFAQKLISPPSKEAIDAAIKLLIDINALEEVPSIRNPERLTTLGKFLTLLPIPPVLGKMIVLGAIFSCLDPILTIACMLYNPSVFTINQQGAKSNKSYWKETRSDHLMWTKMLKRWGWEVRKGTVEKFCLKNGLNQKSINSVFKDKRQIVEILESHNLITKETANANSKNEKLVLAIVTAGLYPNVAEISTEFRVSMISKKDKKSARHLTKEPPVRHLTTSSGSKITIDPRSVTKGIESCSTWVVFYHRMSGVVKDASLIYNVAPIFLFAGKLSLRPIIDDLVGVSVDGFVREGVKTDIALEFENTRKKFDEYLESKLSHPWVTNWNNDEDEEVEFLDEIIRLSDIKF